MTADCEPRRVPFRLCPVERQHESCTVSVELMSIGLGVFGAGSQYLLRGRVGKKQRTINDTDRKSVADPFSQNCYIG